MRDARKGNVGKTTLIPIAKNVRPQYYLLEPSDQIVLMGYQIVQFDAIYTIPWGLLNAFSKQNGQRLRLNGPYIEDLSQHFGNYFSRVALPENREDIVTNYYTYKDEYEARRKQRPSLEPWNELSEQEVILIIKELNDEKKDQ